MLQPKVSHLCGCSLFEKQHMRADANDESAEDSFKCVRGNLAGQPGAANGSDHGQGRQHQNDFKIDVASVNVLEGASEGGGNDDRERSADGGLHRKMHEVDHGGNHDDAAADAEHTTEDAADESYDSGNEIDHPRVIGWSFESGNVFSVRSALFGAMLELPNPIYI